jgi:hypothetical protein
VVLKGKNLIFEELIGWEGTTTNGGQNSFIHYDETALSSLKTPDNFGRELFQLLFDTLDFLFHRLRAVGPCPEFERRSDARSAHLMDHFMTALDGGEDFVPLALDIGAISVQIRFEAGVLQNFLTSRDIFGNRNTHTHGYNAKIGYYLHD